MAIKTIFKHLPYGSYFRPNAFSGVLDGPMFVKTDNFEASPILLSGLKGLSWMDLDEHFPVLRLEEHEWPAINYRVEIEAWNWGRIKHLIESSFFQDEEGDGFDAYGSAFIGTVFSTMPSGKIYAFWTSNQADEDVNRDQQFNEALEAVAQEKGYYVKWGDSSDLFIQKRFTFEEVARMKGYDVVSAEAGKAYWVNDKENTFGDVQDSEEDAWHDCCVSEGLVVG